MVGTKLGRVGRLSAWLVVALVLGLTGTACSGDDEDASANRRPSVAEARQETRENPDDPEAWKDLAAALRTRGDTNAAIPAAQRLLTLEPKDVDAHLRLAVLYLEQGNKYEQNSQPGKARSSFKKAVVVYRRVVAMVPKDQYARIALGQAAEQAGDTATAIAAYTAFLRLTPQDPNAANVRSWLKRLKSA